MSRFNRNSSPVHISGRTVSVPPGGFERAMRKLKKKVQKSNVLQEVKEREQFEKPSAKRRRKKAAAKRRWERYLNSSDNPMNLKR
jgi:small subunit ribosomal protein S21